MNTGQKTLPKDAVFALDIGTRSVIGMLGFVEAGKMKIVAVERAEHDKRAMIDGQIEDIAQVAALARRVRTAMEEKSGYGLKRVYVAAAGRALRTGSASCTIEFPEVSLLEEEQISRLETGAIEEAQKAFQEEAEQDKRFFMVGYTVAQYYLDDYPISSLAGHRGRKIKADIVATFLPGEVVESLYAAMQAADMEVAGLTLEPIAAMNAAIPEKLRLLNLVMVDIGAGTSDIAVCRDGKVVGYTMATLAGDEITEALMQAFLVDFETAEEIKMQLGEKREVVFTDILGYEQHCDSEDILKNLKDATQKLSKEIADRILEVNAGPPSAVFLAGGGSRMVGLVEQITENLGLPSQRASVAGRYYSITASSDEYDLDNPEYATPLGIVVSAGLNLVNDSFSVLLNGNRARLFSNGLLHLSDILMMNGYRYRDMIGRSGSNIIVTVNGERRAFYGEPAQPAVMRINGADAGLSDLVHAGDSITFIPAQSGKAASIKLSDLQTKGQVRCWRVNGEAASPEQALKYGDSVEIEYEGGTEPEITEPSPEAEPEIPMSEVVPEITVPTAKAQPEEPFVEVKSLGGLPQREANATLRRQEESVKEVDIDREEKSYEEKKPAPVEVPAAEKASETTFLERATVPGPLAQGNGILIELNGKQMFLEDREDGRPWYLMDLIRPSGLDLENIKAPVVLEVNGEHALFQQEIKAHDKVSIYENISGKPR